MELNLFKVGNTIQLDRPILPLLDQPIDYVSEIPLSPTDTVLSLSPSLTTNTYNEVYLFVTFKDIETGEDLAINGKLIDKLHGTVLSQISNSYEAQISVFDVPASQLELQFYRKGFKSISTNVAAVLSTPEPHIIYFERGTDFPYLEALALLALIYFATRKKKKVGAVTKEDIFPFLLIGGGLLAFSLVKKILESLGIWQSKDTKELNDTSTDPQSFWNPTFWQTIKPANDSYTYAFTYDQALSMCSTIYNAFGAFNDDEEQAIGVFKLCRTQANASFLCYVFQQYYKEDLLTWLRGGWWPQDRLSDTDVNTINQFVSRLPKY